MKNAVGFRSRKGIEGRYRFHHGTVPVDRAALINHLVSLYGLGDYLEIGVRRRADLLDRVIAPNKIGVDPDPSAQADFVMTSDAFFSQNTRMFDLIFVDGLHMGDQVDRDITNALRCLRPGGFILLHDLNPPTAVHAREAYEVDGDTPDWCGTSWKGYAAHRAREPHLEMQVVDADWGVGIVRPGRQVLYRGPAESYADLERNRAELLNLISVREFLARHPSSRLQTRWFEPLLSR